ncbi:unnamed protein product [Rotaria sp. Silwood1]|nr:unnamed protein product [Rotaria sp. Silwood1]
MQTDLDLDNYDKIERIDNIVSEIHEMRVVKEIVPNIDEHIEKITSQYRNEIDNVFTIIKDTFDFEKWKKQKDSILDRFLKGKKYNDIYATSQHVFLNTTNDRDRKVIEDINNFKYEHVGNDMITLKTANQVGQHLFAQANRVLNIGLYNLMEETKIQTIMLGNTIEIQEIRSIVENLRRIQNATIDLCINEVKKLIEGRIKLFLVSVNDLIKINNFYEADEKIKSITLVSNLLGTFGTQYIFEQIEELNKNLDIVVSNVVVKKYAEMDMNEYTLNPSKDIFDKLGKVSDINPRYAKPLDEIRRSILTKFRIELDETKKKQPPNSDNIHIRKFDSGVKYLPEDMQETLKKDLQHCIVEINKNIEKHNSDLKAACDSRDLKRIKKVIEDYQKFEGMQYYANKGGEYVFQQTQDITSKINENLKEYKIKEALNNIEIISKLINEDKNEIGKHRDERYKKFNEKFPILNKAKVLIDIVSYVENILNRFSTNIHLIRKDYTEFNICYLNFLSFRQEMTSIEYEIKDKIGRIEKIEIWARSAEHDLTIENVTSMLINMNRTSMDMPSFKTKINERIDELLNYYKTITNDNMVFTKLGTLLNQDKTEKRYEQFNKIYQELIQQNLKSNMKLDKLIETIKLIEENRKQEPNEIEWDADIRRKVPELAAHIFALWTLKNVEHYFEADGLLNYIYYGTFNKLCEDIINDNGDIRQVVEQIISKDSNIGMKNIQNIKRAKILLIDEVDIFFSQDFYGNVYTPTATLRDLIITSLVHLIWKERKSKLKLHRLKTTNEYNECCNKYSNWKLLFEEVMKDMLFDVNNFESHGYIVNRDKIGYIEQDNIVYNVAYGYKTLFAYFYEYEK